jgi:hypothetical protein
MGSDSPSLRLRRVLVVEALPDTDGTGPERLGVTSNIPKAPVPNSCPIRRRTPSQSEPTGANVPSHARETPWSQDPPDTSSKLVIRQTLLGRSTSQLRETGHGGGLVSVFVSVAFVRLRSPTLRSDPVMRAGREHARTTGKPGWKACWTDSNRDSNVAEKGPVGGEPVGTARAVNGLSWTVGQARPGPTDL